MVESGAILSSFVLFLSALLTLVSAWDIGNPKDRHECQAPTKHPLDGCDRKRTLYVDAVSSNSKYKTVQSGKLIACFLELGILS